MKVFVTGATGLIGAHAAQALLAAGHRLRLLVRNEAAARTYFQERGHELDDVVVADLRETEKVKAALSGCDAVLHAAALVSLDPRRAQEIYDNNLATTRAVIGHAAEIGIGNIVYVSSLAVFFRPGAPRIDESSELGNPREAYSLSKRDCDEYVRSLQRAGKPVQIVYPAGVLGPDDPKLSEANHAVVSFLTQMVPKTSTGMQCVDVRDVAQGLRFLVEHAPAGDMEAARYVIGGHYFQWREIHALLERVTGTRVFSPPIPGAMLRAMGTIADALRPILPVPDNFSADSMAIATQWSACDSSRFVARSGMTFRPGEETFAATIGWLARAGHLSARRAGKLAST